MRSRLAAGLLTVLTVFVGWSPAEAQRYELAPRVQGGEYLHPFFEGWYELPDGSRVLSYGYFNRNMDPDPVYIPRGEDNFIEPAEFDGMQPDWFPIRRERGVFVVTVRPDWPVDREVIWAFRSEGELYSVPGSSRTGAMQLTTGPAGMGSDRPFLRMDEGGEEGVGIMDPIWGEPRSARVGEPLEITVWGRDNMVDGAAREDLVPVNVAMWGHHGPGYPVIVAEQPPEEEEPEGGRGGGGLGQPARPNSVQVPLESEDGAANFTVTFDEPGDYVLRVMVDNHRAADSGQGDQCCWTNGYVEVNVSQ